jgi:hypothetical protein
VDIAGIAVCAGILCAPLAWHHYVLIAAPFYASRRWGLRETVAGALTALPNLFDGQAFEAGSRLFVLLVALPHLIGLVLMLISFLDHPVSNDPVIGNEGERVLEVEVPSFSLPGLNNNISI